MVMTRIGKRLRSPWKSVFFQYFQLNSSPRFDHHPLILLRCVTIVTKFFSTIYFFRPFSSILDSHNFVFHKSPPHTKSSPPNDFDQKNDHIKNQFSSIIVALLIIAFLFYADMLPDRDT